MIKFFRKIRQKFILEKRFSKYLIYAAGEILLVMVGILLALQVNNANENRKNQIMEQAYLRSLKQEFGNNLIALEHVMSLNAQNMENAQKLTTLTGPETPGVSDEKLASLIFGTINNEVQYRPGTGVLDEIISSGKLELFRNQEFKSALASWSKFLQSITYQEHEHGTTRFDLIETLNEETVNARKMVYLTFGELYRMEQTKFETSNLHLLQSQKFENQIVGFLLTAGFLQDNYYSNMEKEIDEILDLIDLELKNN